MPNKNGTGPEGKGAKTGRGAGGCQPEKDTDRSTRPGTGRGQGRGQGRNQGKGQGRGRA